MARKPRIHLPGGVYHVMLRGNGGAPIFFADEDPLRFEALIGEGVARYGHRVHAYCLMNNHVHIAVQTGQEPLSKAMQNLAFRYTRWINDREQRAGHLFQGRFKAILVDADAYLLELVRYIHLNPLRAGLVSDPADHPWSSHRVYLGLRRVDWLTTDWVLSRFSGDEAKARLRYAEFVSAGRGETRREEFHCGTVQGRVLGDDDFIRRALSQTGEGARAKVRLDSIVTAVCAARRLDWETLRATSRQRIAADARALLAYLVSETQATTLTQLAKLLNRDVATLSNAVHRFRERLKTDTGLAAERERLLAILMLEKKLKA